MRQFEVGMREREEGGKGGESRGSDCGAGKLLERAGSSRVE